MLTDWISRLRLIRQTGIGRVEDFGRDVRYGVRQLRRSPAFAAAALLCLALGIGATTAIYSLVSTILLQPLPFRGADRLVTIVENVPPSGPTPGHATRTHVSRVSRMAREGPDALGRDGRRRWRTAARADSQWSRGPLGWDGSTRHVHDARRPRASGPDARPC